LTKSYFYANGQILTGYKYDGVDVNDVPVIEYKNFHIHDRLGSTRLVVDSDGSVKNSRTFTPFGQDLDYSYSRENYFRYTGQWYDIEIDQYYLRARMYDPQLMRFTTRDPVRGKYKEPMALHRYLYCQNEPLNRIDPFGKDYVDINITWTYGMAAGAIQGAVLGAGLGPKGAAIGSAVGFVAGGCGATGGVMYDKQSNEAHFYLGLSWGPSLSGGTDVTMSFAPDPQATVESGWHIGFAGTYGGGYTQWSRNLQTGGAAWEFGMTTGANMALGGNVSLFYVFEGMNIAFGDPRSAYNNLDLLTKAVMMNQMREDTGSLMTNGRLGGGILGSMAGIGFISMSSVTSSMLLGM